MPADPSSSGDRGSYASQEHPAKERPDPAAFASQLFEHLADVNGDAQDLARLCNTILSRSLAGEKGSSFYRDVDEAISLARTLAEDEGSTRGETALREIERRMKRIRNRRNRG